MLSSVVYAPNASNTVAGFGLAGVSAFPGVAGQTIGYYTYVTNSEDFLPYDLIIMIEEL